MWEGAREIRWGFACMAVSILLCFILCVCRIAMELYEGVSRRMGIPEVVIRGSMEYMKQSRIFVVTFLGVLDPIQRILSTPQVCLCHYVCN